MSTPHPPRTTATHHRVLVVGAGLGGLVLARVLHVNGVTATVLDLDASPTARDQGGMLDLHAGSGQAALRTADLWEEFVAIVHRGGEAMRILARDGEVLLDEADEERASGEGLEGRPEVDRNDLRRVLLDSLPSGTVRWGSKVVAVQPRDDGRHRVELDDGSVMTTDLLVGADGTWSKVRPLVSDARPGYSGVSFVESDLLETNAWYRTTADLVGAGMMMAFAGDRGMITHLETDGSVHAYVARKVGEEWLSTLDPGDPDACRVAVLEHFTGWDERLRALVAHADGPLVLRPVHALPVGHSWERVPGVTLLGDAAHVMSPFAGEGANLAMLDGAELATALVEHADDVETALGAYERALFPRSTSAAKESADNLDVMFSPTSPQPLLDMFTETSTGTGGGLPGAS